MVQFIPTNDNPTKNEIDAYILEMLNGINGNTIDNYNVLHDVVREIHSKSGVGALLHPAEEYFVSKFNSSAKNMSLEDLRLPDQRYNFDTEHNDS
jgi:hypothetical protein